MIKDGTEMTDHCSENGNVLSKGFYLQEALRVLWGGLPLRPALAGPELSAELLALCPGPLFDPQVQGIRTGSKRWLC